MPASWYKTTQSTRIKYIIPNYTKYGNQTSGYGYDLLKTNVEDIRLYNSSVIIKLP